jgi:Fe2+ transport system protein B|tara:strand:+ start:942 stop:1415 length:474 start_codon:yes stop_codon:yes gene_type:complete
MIAETLAGIALVKSAVDGIKSTINTANDIGDIAKYVDNLLEGEKQVQQQRAKKSGASISDQFGIESVAQEVIDARIAQEKIQEMRTLVDMRFGPGTWQSIVDLRNKRIKEAKEAAAKARREAMLRQQEMIDSIKLAAGIGFMVALGVGFLIFLLTIV